MPELVQGKTAAELVEAIRRTPNDADPVLIQELSNLRSAEALVGLMEVYDVLGSVYLRREVLRGLSLYDEVAGSEQPALVHLMHCATESKDRELRLEAVAIIGDSHNFGRPYLKRIVDSPADDDVRVEALRLHTANAEAEDRAWYQSLLSPRSPQPTGGRKSKNEEPPKLPHVLGELRLLAFQALAPDMSDEELLRAARDGNMSIREHALRALAASGFPETRALALEVVKNFSEWPQNRAAATAVLGRYADLELVEELIDMAGRRDTPEELILALGDMLAELDEPEIEAYLAKQATKGKDKERRAAMLGARDVPDEKLDKSLIKLLTNKDEELQHLAVRLLAERRVKSALPELEQLAHKAKDSATVTATLRAITELRKFDKAWHAELVQWASSPTVETRNGALALLAELGDKTFEPTLIAALQHPHWSTRLAAAKGLERLRTRGAVGALIARLPAESGHLQHELGDMLWRLTGQGFGENARVWADWWAEHGATFELVGAAQLELLLEDAAERELKRVTTASSFFGIRVESERVIFILDVSGSMDEPTRGKYVGEVGDLRIEVAKRELTRCLKGLAADSQFNVITFSGNVRPWSDTIQDWAPDTLDDASKFVNKLRAGGGSDLFAALEAAFEDEEVDTIYVLSDGEPSMGVVIEPVSIRARVEQWNRDRGVTIHAIAVGGSFRILEWLAEDSGGTHVRIP